MCALAADRQVAAVAESAIGADFDETLDVHRNFLAQIALHQPFSLNDRTDAVNFFFAQVLHLLHRVDLGVIAEATGARMTDAVDVRQRDVDVLLARKIDACNTCHVFLTSRCRVPHFSRSLREVGILNLYPWRCLCFELTQITRTTPLRWMTLHLSQIFFTDALTFITVLSSRSQFPVNQPGFRLAGQPMRLS